LSDTPTLPAARVEDPNLGAEDPLKNKKILRRNTIIGEASGWAGFGWVPRKFLPPPARPATARWAGRPAATPQKRDPSAADEDDPRW